LIPNPVDGRRLRYNSNIDREDIRPGLERILNNIRILLQDADQVDEKYGLRASPGKGSDVSTSLGMNIFRDSFERFKARMRQNQNQKSTWKVTRWAIHDAVRFETMIGRLEKYVDGLEKLTDSLGRLEQRLREEIDNISDVQSLILLRDASSSNPGSSQRDVSDTASRRLSSFVTAQTKVPTLMSSASNGDLPVPGAWPRSLISATSRGASDSQQIEGGRGIPRLVSSCSECIEEHYKCSKDDEYFACRRCLSKGRSCSFDREMTESSDVDSKQTKNVFEVPIQLGTSRSEVFLEPQDVPQNQRLVGDLLQNAGLHKPLSFEAGDAHYGECLERFKKADISYMLQNSGKLLSHANSSSSAAKRMFLELRNIRTANVPFVSAVPLGDNLDRVLASIEGPPETPYEGGVFWITVRLSEKDPLGPPLMRFQTKIYHPNISPQGHICSDYSQRWNDPSPKSRRRLAKDPGATWYGRKSTDIQWSLGALLMALCGLLASPDADDPLVPEIAQQYLANYGNYCEAARMYTKRYAGQERPDEHELQFLDDTVKCGDTEGVAVLSPSLTAGSDTETDDISLHRSLSDMYNERYPGKAESMSDFVNFWFSRSIESELLDSLAK
jgi:ubiquitin-protein ligase